MDEHKPINELRRKDRAVTDEAWIRTYLTKAAVGTIASVYEGQPYININLYVYDETENAIFFHTAQSGRTRTNIELGGPVCFSVMEMGRLLPADTALEFSVEYSSVIVFGRASVLGSRTEKRRALQMLLDKYFRHLKPGVDYQHITVEELKRTSVYKLEIEHWSAKRKVVEPDFPGAFSYPA